MGLRFKLFGVTQTAQVREAFVWLTVLLGWSCLYGIGWAQSTSAEPLSKPKVATPSPNLHKPQAMVQAVHSQHAEKALSEQRPHEKIRVQKTPSTPKKSVALENFENLKNLDKLKRDKGAQVSKLEETGSKRSTLKNDVSESNRKQPASPANTEGRQTQTLSPSTAELRKSSSELNASTPSLPTEKEESLSEQSTQALKAPLTDNVFDKPPGADIGNTDNLPLSLNEAQQQASAQVSSNLMWRMVLSLVTVLFLMLAFVRWMLPKLMARYPEFFNRLQQQNQTHSSAVGLSPLKKQSEPSQSSTGPKKYLEKFQTQNKHFQVVTSTSLGKGKELHLVEIQGRQLVIATTPFSVTLLKDLTEPLESMDGRDGYWEEDKSLIQVLMSKTLPAQPVGTTGRLSKQAAEVFVSEASNDEEAGALAKYLKVDASLSSRRPLKPKPLASKVAIAESEDPNPVTLERQEQASPLSENPSAQETLYLKYLNPGPGPHDRLKQRLQSPVGVMIGDVEEIVLNDYDDTY